MEGKSVKLGNASFMVQVARVAVELYGIRQKADFVSGENSCRIHAAKRGLDCSAIMPEYAQR